MVKAKNAIRMELFLLKDILKKTLLNMKEIIIMEVSMVRELTHTQMVTNMREIGKMD